MAAPKLPPGATGRWVCLPARGGASLACLKAAVPALQFGGKPYSTIYESLKAAFGVAMLLRPRDSFVVRLSHVACRMSHETPTRSVRHAKE